MDRARNAGLCAAGTDYAACIARGREWIEGMQSHNGGFGAFDADNDLDYLNYIPFADHGALLDPPTADVTARCVSMLAQLGEKPTTQQTACPRLGLSAERASGRRQLVRPLGRQLHLWHVVGAIRSQRRRHRLQSFCREKGCRLAEGNPER